LTAPASRVKCEEALTVPVEARFPATGTAKSPISV